MFTVRIVTVALTVVMFGAIALATATGDFGDEGSWILGHPWGRMSLIDLYVGIALFTGWVFLRERNPWVGVVWIPAFFVLGNAATALYAVIAAFRSEDVNAFLLGARRDSGRP